LNSLIIRRFTLSGQIPDLSARTRIKSLFASFSSEKEESSFQKRTSFYPFRCPPAPTISAPASRAGRPEGAGHCQHGEGNVADAARGQRHARVEHALLLVILGQNFVPFRKGKASMFFSEEKNQKTFTSPPRPRSRPWPVSFRWHRNKSFFRLFFRKEDLPGLACLQNAG
jgi:hypothetical protein